MSNLHIFDKANRRKLRFSTAKGLINSEALWDLPTESRSRDSLKAMEQAVYDEIQATRGHQLRAKSTDKNSDQELRLEILTFIIDTKEASAAAATKKASDASLLKELLEIKANSDKQKLLDMSEEERDALIAKLSQ